MKQFRAQFIKEQKDLGLHADEKSVVRDRLVQQMQLQPVRILASNRQDIQHAKKGKFLFFNQKYMFAKILVAVILALTGGTSVAAETALPGDFLYPVKVEVNERVRSVASFSTEAKANWETRVVERRAEEAQRLVEQDEDLTVQERAEFTSSVEAHVAHLEGLADELDAKGNEQAAAQVAARLGTAIEAVSSSLSKVRVREEHASMGDEKKNEHADEKSTNGMHDDMDEQDDVDMIAPMDGQEKDDHAVELKTPAPKKEMHDQEVEDVVEVQVQKGMPTQDDDMMEYMDEQKHEDADEHDDVDVHVQENIDVNADL
ncbi:MAG: hypothetical protein GW939_02790 [Candidatus Magasanikbacteria bacterium]|uniref:DUF5667 domain-containing protein n=1 Tax=Candidatus Magasanikbacteria bacterium CG10_big_fil_rev_8_21_14_0_10_38_6 TaxID=1974647 RepID=A0A2M6P0M9_9BACT|nr:hypothetical protein [Candidatus Magasanikbacteria bacterium]PIR77292.1 MAG: hypothetical protein COU30_03245 [Candidatus Magasanikbacteria bacterium CG10_big_fil_rev_8_21_14_0_10_38_6]